MSYNDQFYKKISGAAMGSHISPVIANIFMEHFAKEILKKTGSLILLRRWHIRDLETNRAELRKFLIFLNNQHPNIGFTMDIEENKKLSFLNVLVTKKADNILYIIKYRKPRHTDKYNTYVLSRIIIQHKNSQL